MDVTLDLEDVRRLGGLALCWIKKLEIDAMLGGETLDSEIVEDIECLHRIHAAIRAEPSE